MASAALHRKRLEMLKDLIPSAARIVYLANPNNPEAKASAYDVLSGAEAMRMQVDIVNARTESEIDTVFGAMKQMRGFLRGIDTEVQRDKEDRI